MKLSNDLISQFVKNTADKDTTKKETTVYGTVVKQGSNIFAKLDGSELLTPVSSTTVVKNGERVTVMIKNHTAVITGNISSPSAQDSDVKEVGSKISEFEIIIAGKVSTTEFEAEKARINSLVADNVLIKDKLTANDATIGKLETDYLAVNGKLTAAEADISNLKTKKLDAEIANITYATIANLEATNIKVNNLESTYGDFKDLVTEKLTASEAEIIDLKTKKLDAESAELLYAKIGDFTAINGKVEFLEAGMLKVNTLIGGNITAGSTDTIVLNARNTTIENALIKSAMVESLAFDKITGIDINTTKLTVHSNDGKSKWMDNTIQISDSKRIRVQIGKDASGDYNMYVWDVAGKLMFDATGITASGIQRPIIVDSMVADNANIAGDKINIASLVKEINDGTEVIKSSHILVDGANQSLSVVYNTITGDISKLSTNLSVEQGKISSLITDVSTAKGDVATLKTNYSSLTQTVNGINSTVSSHTSSIDNLNNMEIGGRNLALKTAVSKTMVGANIKNQTADFYNLTGNADDYKGKKITVSYDYEITGDIKTGTISLRFNSNPWSSIDSPIYLGTDAEKGHRKFTSVVPNGITGLNIGVRADGMQGTIIFKNVKIVFGDKITGGWVPAPEDIDASIKTVSDKTSVLEQTVNGFDARITSATSTAGNALTKAMELSATVDGYNVRISAAETNASSALSKTNVLEQKVTATSLITTISSGISGGTALTTTKFIMDVSGLHIKNGGFDISNNAGTKVFTADANGNLSITAAINAASGKFGKWTINSNGSIESISNDNTGGMIKIQNTAMAAGSSVLISNAIDSERMLITTGAGGNAEIYASHDRGGGGGTYVLGASYGASYSYVKVGDCMGYPNGGYGVATSSNIYAGGSIDAEYIACRHGNEITFNSSGNTMWLNYRAGAKGVAVNTVIIGAGTANGTRGNLYCRGIDLTDTIFSPGWFRSTGTTGWYNETYAGGIYMTDSTYVRVYNNKGLVVNNNCWLGSQYSTTSGYIGFYSAIAGGSRKGWFGHNGGTDFHWRNETNSSNGVFLDAKASGYWTHGRFAPGYDGMALGSSGARWYRMYATKACDTASDIRLKTNIHGYDDRYEKMYMDLKPVLYELKQYIGQTDCGLIAQWVKDSMDKHGISEREFGVYNYHSEDDTYGLAYEQLTSLNMHMIQKTIKRVDKHDEEISKLKQENEELKAKLNAYIKGELEVRTCLS